MNIIKNSKKNDAGNLLPQRKPRLGKYLALAIILHVVFITAYIYFTQREPIQRPEVSAPPVKISLLSDNKKKLIHHRVESTGVLSFSTAVRPSMPPQVMALPDPIESTSLPQHRPVSQAQIRLIQIEKISQLLSFSKESIKGLQDLKGHKSMPVAEPLPLPIDLSPNLPAIKPSLMVNISKSHTIIDNMILSRETIRSTDRFETTAKAAYLSSEINWKQELEFLPPLSNNVPLHPELPLLIEDHLTDSVKRLVRPALQKYAEPIICVQAKNITYRDLGLESEGTKFLSGLVKTEIEKQDGMELLAPADVSRGPQILIEGEMWDNSKMLKVHLWALDQGTGHIISAEDLTFRKTLMPDKLKIQPPSGEHLSMIKRVVDLIKQNFPRGGDFQLNVWPDKGLDAVYVEGEILIVYIMPEKNAYLHVDYYQIDGKVVHLLPNTHESNYIKAGTSYKIGDPKSVGYEFKVCEPFGEELIVVVASQNPLGTIAHSLIEPAESYIKRLTDRLGRQRKETSMAGSHCIILTKKRDTAK